MARPSKIIETFVIRFIPLLLFIAVPIIEIALFIEVGGLIGLWPTIAVVILTAIAGSALLRAQGLHVLAEARRDIDAGRVPVARIADGLFLLVAAVLLLTPGFMTDALGLVLFVPGVRAGIGRWLLGLIMASDKVEVHHHSSRSGHRTQGRPDIIDGEAVEIDLEAEDESDGQGAGGNAPTSGSGSGWRREP